MKEAFVLLGVILLAISCTSTQAPPQKPAPPPLEFLGAWGPHGEGPGQLSQPVALTTDKVGNIYTADAASLYVTKFDPEGHPRMSFQTAQRPLSLAVDLGGAIYVGTDAPPSVSIYFPQGEPMREIRGGPEWRLRKPASIVVDEDGYFYVADAACDCIQKFNPRGRLVKLWAEVATELANSTD